MPKSIRQKLREETAAEDDEDEEDDDVIKTVMTGK